MDWNRVAAYCSRRYVNGDRDTVMHRLWLRAYIYAARHTDDWAFPESKLK